MYNPETRIVLLVSSLTEKEDLVNTDIIILITWLIDGFHSIFSLWQLEGKRVMWCGYWPISRQHGDVMPSGSHGKKHRGIHLYRRYPILVHIANVLASSTKVYQTRTASDLQVVLHSRKQMKWTAAHNPFLLITDDIVQWYRHSNCVLVTVATYTVSLLNSSVPQRPPDVPFPHEHLAQN